MQYSRVDPADFRLTGKEIEQNEAQGHRGRWKINTASVSCYVFFTTVLFFSGFKIVHCPLGGGSFRKVVLDPV